MSTRSRLAWTLRSVVFVVAVQTATPQASSGMGYLPRSGPSPLRLNAEKPSANKSILPPLAMDDAQSVAQATPVSTLLSSRNLMSQSAANPADFDQASYLNPQLPLWAGAIEKMFSGTLSPSRVESLAVNSLPALPTAKNAPVITPQMLVDYFKPARGSTNAASVSVIVPVDFTPPTAATMPPSSQAIYRTP